MIGDDLAHVQVTIDGPKELHDRRRIGRGGKGSFDRIIRGVHMLLKSHIDISIRINLDAQNIHSMASLADYFHEQGWGDRENLKIFCGTYRDLVSYDYKFHMPEPDAIDYMMKLYRNPRNRIIKLFAWPGIDYISNLLNTNDHKSLRTRYCKANFDRWAFTPDGRVYPCGTAGGNIQCAIGTYYPEIRIDKAMLDKWRNRSVLNIPKCKTCDLALICGGGCALQAELKNKDVSKHCCYPRHLRKYQGLPQPRSGVHKPMKSSRFNMVLSAAGRKILMNYITCSVDEITPELEDIFLAQDFSSIPSEENVGYLIRRGYIETSDPPGAFSPSSRYTHLQNGKYKIWLKEGNWHTFLVPEIALFDADCAQAASIMIVDRAENVHRLSDKTDLVDAVLQSGKSLALNLVFKQNGQVIKTGGINLIKDLDSIRFPARELLPPDRYKRRQVLSSRGCIHKCIYCAATAMNHSKWRKRTAENVVEELGELARVYGGRFYFADDNFTVDNQRVTAICELMMDNTPDFHWSCLSRVENLKNDSMLRTMKAAGCHEIFLGVESGSTRVLKAMKRNYDAEKVTGVVERCNRAGINTTLSFIIGIPFEEKEDIQATLDLARHVPSNNIAFHMFTPYMGTESYNHPEKYGLTLLETDPDEFDKNSYPIIETRHLSQEDIFDYYCEGFGVSYLKARQKAFGDKI